MFDYFYGNEHEQYLHIQIPLMLIKDPIFKNLSGDSKLLYGLLLNRTSLSARNGWRDSEGRVYIIYTVKEIMEDINCGNQKVTKLLQELDTGKGVGLIERKRQGLNKPDLIYVKNYSTSLKYRKGENHTSRKCENHISNNVKIMSQEITESHASHNDFKNIYKNDIENKSVKSSQSASYPQEEKNDLTRPAVTDNTTRQNSSENEKEFPQSTASQSKGLNENSNHLKKQSNFNQYTTYAEWESRIKNNIGYEYFIQDREPYIKLIDTIVHNVIGILTETGDFITLNKKENKRINTAIAKEMCLRLNHDHILYVLEKFKNVSDPITHKGNYLKSMILSSLDEMEAYYQNEYRQGNL